MPAPPGADVPRVIVLGASAGGVEVLRTVVGRLPADLGAAVLVVLHVSAAGTSALPAILARAGPLPACSAADGDVLRAGTVFVAPPDRHLVIEDDRLALTRGPRENGHRPAIDTTMRSVAERWGEAVTGVVLTGTRDDGTAGLAAIKAAGGRAAAQDPETALYPAMPRSAMQNVSLDAVLAAEQIGAWLAAVSGPRDSCVQSPAQALGDATANATCFTCPDCGGVLYETSDEGLLRYRCSVGHAYSPDSLMGETGTSVEGALWTAVRTLEDRAVLLDRLAAHANDNGHRYSAGGFRRQAAHHRDNAEALRATLGFPPPGAGSQEHPRDVGAGSAS
jgi:two-component system chemotaxis response regulator CheB